MPSIFALLGTLADLLIVMFGFGLIVFIHELGHFLAARWAGIRVLAFAVGFGPAVFSYRKGFGWQRGSSEARYRAWLEREAKATTAHKDRAEDAISPTEYRLNALPLGGYVKMLGQEDLNPDATSEASDSYQRCIPWKRMVVISAGVIMNLIGAAVLFVIVFGAGLDVTPPKVGRVLPGSAAAEAAAMNAAEAGATAEGLRQGDVIALVNGEPPRSFEDVSFATALAEPGEPMDLVVERAGLDEPLRFSITPRPGELSQGLLELGFVPPRTLALAGGGEPEATRRELEALFEQSGLGGVPAGSTLVAIDGRGGLTGVADLEAAFEASGGEALTLTFETPASERVEVVVSPEPVYEIAYAPMPRGSFLPVEHLLGLTPVMRVDPSATDAKQGLRPGDVFERIGAVEYPSVADGVREIRSRRGRDVDLAVRRGSDRVTLTARVNRQGQVGFDLGDTSAVSSLVAATPEGLLASPAARKPVETPLAIEWPGSRIVSVAGEPTPDLLALRERLRAVSAAAPEGELIVLATVERPLSGATGPVVETIEWRLTPSDRERLAALTWSSPISPAVFEAETIKLVAGSPVEAVAIGLHETKRILVSTYVQLVRMFQGSVKIEHIKGPVGIAHIGTVIADRGVVWLLFFFAMISVNLAVINFLPLPIVDGGQFLMLVYEQLRGKPVPLGFQNAITTAGLLLIISVFLIVTFNDVRALLGM